MHSFFIQQQQTFETILTDYTREKKIDPSGMTIKSI